MSNFVHLHLHSMYSLLDGACRLKETVSRAAELGQKAVAVTDHGVMYGTVDLYNEAKKAGINSRIINGKTALVRKIDLDFIDEMGRTNLVRMQQGLAPLDSTGIPYELHHIGQDVDSTLAILTREEHRLAGNSKIWHEFGTGSDVHTAGNNWDTQRKLFWQSFAKLAGG